MFGVAENIKTLLVNSMEKWRVMLCAGNSESGEINIKWGNFQGDSFLLYFCFSIDFITFDFEKDQGSIRVFKK